jgi:hypothetical protein
LGFVEGEIQREEQVGNRLGELREAVGGPTKRLLSGLAQIGAAGYGAEPEEGQRGNGVPGGFGAIVVFLAAENQVG